MNIEELHDLKTTIEAAYYGSNTNMNNRHNNTLN